MQPGANDSCTLTGNVTMTRGSLNIVAAKAIIEQSGGDPSRALLSGGGPAPDPRRRQPDQRHRQQHRLRPQDRSGGVHGNVEIRQRRGTLNGPVTAT